jgi:hypothetical protein
MHFFTIQVTQYFAQQLQDTYAKVVSNAEARKQGLEQKVKSRQREKDELEEKSSIPVEQVQERDNSFSTAGAFTEGTSAEQVNRSIERRKKRNVALLARIALVDSDAQSRAIVGAGVHSVRQMVTAIAHRGNLDPLTYVLLFGKISRNS